MIAPPPRRGPRPLLLHLLLSSLRSPPFSPASMPSNNASPFLSAPLLRLLSAAPPASPANGSLPAELVAGIAAYRRHPTRRDLEDPPALWTEGESRLLDYGGPPDGRPVLFVPSLVNRAYILDLAEGRSMLRHLAARHRVLLLDWGWPGAAERGFTLTDYIAGRLERAIAAIGQPITLAGYCMGGLLAIAAAQRRPDLVQALVLLATPWDFHAADPQAAGKLAALLPWLEPLMAPTNRLPIDALQTLFALLDPASIAGKYAGFARIDPDSPRAHQFVAIEDWLNDGVPLAGPVARECLAGWYGANTPATLAWRVAGEPIDPARLAVPAFVAIPARDRIVPPESAAPLAALIPGATVHSPAAGHVGMVAGGSAERALWQPLDAWLAAL